MELYDRGAWYTVKQRIEELKKWLELAPNSKLALKRRTELVAAEEQLKKIIGGS